MIGSYVRRVSRDAWQKTMHDVVGHTLGQRFARAFMALTVLGSAYLYVRLVNLTSSAFQDAARSLVIGATAFLVVGAIWFAINLLVLVPYRLWLEQWEKAAAASKTLAENIANRPKPIRDKISLTKGLLYAVFTDWDHSVHDLSDEDQAAFLAGKMREFQQLAHEKDLTIWGREGRHGVHQRLDPSVWLEQKIEWGSMIEGKPGTAYLFTSKPKQFDLFHRLLVSRAEIEGLFSAEETEHGGA